MSKKRLEELETKYSTLTVSSERDGIEYTDVDVKDLVFLIQNGFKQAEKVEELEDDNEALQTLSNVNRKEHMRLHEQNKRYREALKNIYELAEYDEYDNTLEQIVLEVDKALEGEK